MEMLFLIVVISTVGIIAYPSLQANNVSIVVCSSFLTSSNMSKNFNSPRIYHTLFLGLLF